MQEHGGTVRTEGSCRGPTSGQLLCYADYLCISSVLRLKTHIVAFKAATASHEPTLIGGFEVENSQGDRRRGASGRKVGRAGLGEKSGTRIEWQRNKVEIPEIGAADAT